VRARKGDAEFLKIRKYLGVVINDDQIFGNFNNFYENHK